MLKVDYLIIIFDDPVVDMTRERLQSINLCECECECVSERVRMCLCVHQNIQYILRHQLQPDTTFKLSKSVNPTFTVAPATPTMHLVATEPQSWN